MLIFNNNISNNNMKLLCNNNFNPYKFAIDSNSVNNIILTKQYEKSYHKLYEKYLNNHIFKNDIKYNKLLNMGIHPDLINHTTHNEGKELINKKLNLNDFYKSKKKILNSILSKNIIDKLKKMGINNFQLKLTSLKDAESLLNNIISLNDYYNIIFNRFNDFQLLNKKISTTLLENLIESYDGYLIDNLNDKDIWDITNGNINEFDILLRFLEKI
jgi:hypothetical protein